LLGARAISIYLEWVHGVCVAKGIRINGDVAHVKDDKLYCIPSNAGDLYLKKTTNFIVDELRFTLKLMELGIINEPKIIGYDMDMQVCLMRDMGGSDLSELPTLDMDIALDMFKALARIQKNSIQYANSEGFCGFDYTIGTMLEELDGLPDTACEMLLGTQYRLSQDEIERLKRNVAHVKVALDELKVSHIPNTIHHGDLAAYNVRIIDGKSIFYDWGCGGVAHPFFDTFRLLGNVRKKFPTDIPAKQIIVDTYIREWLEYGCYEELKGMFEAVGGLAGFYMAYVKYVRARNLHLSFAGKEGVATGDAVGLDRRYETAAIYLRRFLEHNY